MDSSTSTAHPHTWDFPGGSHGPAEQVLSNISHCLWVHEASWIQHRASEHPQQALQRFGAFSTPVWVTAQQIQTSAKPRSRESRKRTAMENVEKLIYFSPLSKTKLFYSLPSPSTPKHCLAHHCTHKPIWKTWRCQSLEGIINPQWQGKAALGSQVTSVHGLVSGCQQSALEALSSAGTTSLAAAKANKVPFCAPFIPTNKHAGGGKALERQRASGSL